MLVLSERDFAGNRYYGLSFLFDILISPIVESALPMRYVYVDRIESQSEFDRIMRDELKDQEIVLIASVASRYITKPFLKQLKLEGRKIVAFYTESFRYWLSYKNYRPYQKHYWYHDKIHHQTRVGAYADAIIQIDQANSEFPDRTIFTPSFQPRQVFFPAAVNGKTIDVSFLGSRDKAGRMDYINAYPGVFVAGGGFGIERIGLDRYADYIRSSKLSLQVPFFIRSTDLLNSRVTQILYSRTALLHPPGPNICRFFEPGVDFIPIESPEDFAEKTRYYLAHDNEREQIAHNGWKKATEQHSFAAVWKRVEELLGVR